MHITKFLYGGDYNPEQWKNYPDILKEDIRLMKKAKCNTMTMGVFSWAEIEKQENCFDFSFMDSVIDEIYKNGGNIVLATPTAGIPRWLRNKSDDIIKTNEKGEKERFGRMNFCYTSPLFLQRVKILNTQLASHYKDNPAVILWHISNEFDTPCYCDRCVKNFQSWLEKKYKTIDNLNNEWWTSFWSGTFNSWDEISPKGDVMIHALYLDWRRFYTEEIGEYIKFEKDILKSITPNIPVTTNYMHLYDKINYNKWNDIVDVVSWDSYPKWHIEDDEMTAVKTAFAHDVFRSMKMQPFLLMESATSCPSTQNPTCKNKKPEFNILSSLQAVAHGSDSVMYFQWRKSRGCQEKFHGAVVGHDGSEDTRVFKEVEKLGSILEKISCVARSNTKSEVAIVYDWENKWSLDVLWGLQNGPKKYEQTCNLHYKPFWDMGVNTDVIDLGKPFDKYKIVIAPMLHMISEDTENKIEEYVKNGGVFIGTYLMGYVNENNLCHLNGYPCGKLKKVFGISVLETEALREDEINTVNGFNAYDYCDMIKQDTAEILGKYDKDYFKGIPAFTKNKYGKGYAYYIGFRDDGEFLKDFYYKLAEENNIYKIIEDLPCGVTAQTRYDNNNQFVIIQNYNDFAVSIKLENSYYDLINEKNTDVQLNVGAYGVAVLKRN